ncbi:MAG: lytic transglycosylase domain-containing protein [Rhodoferax sp.]|jgi:soluble lytic murein transglycosylase-like protein|uniref:lytic transglycosylase domain-containing protein n=1 Tax=Rhodoferax sp. TaxID=50421 RepID=UPI001B521582|nr:lytic transglycosylase domain-containing protein [Rhodoferax sp.]MBP8285258.1 lytic transglycosylase domain-containing protein [Rhodoferax sp.]MBP9736454.1 lytic transglycosylase domain-containing protein [Rhodoferax sp.]
MKRDVCPIIVIAATLAGAIPVECWGSCWERAAATYAMDPLLLKAIGWQESRGWSQAVGPKLAQGNVALGVMQINTVHLPRLAQFGMTRQDLFDACVNQTVGAWVLADCIAQMGSTWKAVGCYYAGPRSTNLAKQAQYVSEVRKHYEGYRRQQLQASSDHVVAQGLP